MSDTIKTVMAFFENALDTYEHQTMLIDECEFYEPSPEEMQTSNNIVWRPAQQHRPVLDGWDLTGLETDIIEEGYYNVLGTPKNDFIKQRADEMRKLTFWERAGKQAGKRQATELNSSIASTIATQGSLFYRSNVTSGYEFVAEGQAMLNERQVSADSRCFVLNDRDTLTFSSDLAARQTLQGRPEETWKTGQIGRNVAEFDVFTGSFLPNLAGGADPATTVTADQSFVPEGGTITTSTGGGVVTNNDYRSATIPVTASASYNVGDKVTFSNGGTPVTALGLADKVDTGQPMTFTIVAKPTGTSVVVYPKPIALDDPALSTLEKAYANIDTQILNLATMDRLNIDTTNKTNLFWDRGAVEVLGGTIPAELFSQFDGMKSVTETMSNGLNMYMFYDGSIEDLTLRYRLFTWYGTTVANPMAAGVGVTY